MKSFCLDTKKNLQKFVTCWIGIYNTSNPKNEYYQYLLTTIDIFIFVLSRPVKSSNSAENSDSLKVKPFLPFSFVVQNSIVCLWQSKERSKKALSVFTMSHFGTKISSCSYFYCFFHFLVDHLMVSKLVKETNLSKLFFTHFFFQNGPQCLLLPEELWLNFIFYSTPKPCFDVTEN